MGGFLRNHETNELIETLPRGVLTFYKSDKGLHKSIAENEKNITPGFNVYLYFEIEYIHFHHIQYLSILKI